MSQRNFSAGRLMLDTILLLRLAAASKVRMQRTCLRFPAGLPNRSNTSQLLPLTTLLPRRKEPWEDMRPARLDKIRVELGYRQQGSNYLTIVNWSGGLMPERCWRAWALRFPQAQTQHSGRTAGRSLSAIHRTTWISSMRWLIRRIFRSRSRSRSNRSLSRSIRIISRNLDSIGCWDRLV